MKFKAQDWELFYTIHSSTRGTYDVLAFSEKQDSLYLSDSVDGAFMSGMDDEGTPYEAIRISRTIFEELKKQLQRKHEAIVGFPWTYKPTAPKTKDTRPLVPQERVLQAIRGELSESELRPLEHGRLEPGAYFCFDAFMEGIHRFMRGEVSTDYYQGWLILLTNAMYSTSYRKGSKKARICSDLGWCFDGHSFLHYDDLMTQCRDLIHSVKEFHHQFQHVHLPEPPPLSNPDNSVVYICFSYCNGANEYHKICVVDENTRRFNLTYIINPDYLEEVNYNTLIEDDFDDLPNALYDYIQDPTLDVNNYIRQLPYQVWDEDEEMTP